MFSITKKNTKHKVELLCLVAKKLRFNHPVTNQTLDFEIDLPNHFKDFIALLDNIDLKEND